jgi:hypothetical protein
LKRLVALLAVGTLMASLVVAQTAQAHRKLGSEVTPHLSATQHPEGLAHFCNTNGVNCTEPFQTWGEFPWFKHAEKHSPITEYIGHDEPSVLFYSDKAGSGNENKYVFKLPKDPPKRPRTDGSGGTDNFQLRPAFWFGMAMCDNQGGPNPGVKPGDPTPQTVKCKPDSNSNIFLSQNPNSPKYIGLHPGVAFMEMQFYPPGWVPWPPGIGCTARQWCAALNIDTFQFNDNLGTINNTDCVNNAGVEPVNFAFITKNGKSTADANPLSPNRFTPVKGKDFLMGSGDRIKLHMFDAAKGFTVKLHDLSRGTNGSMKASVKNGFGKLKYDPNASSCQLLPSAYHPAYSTSTPHTIVPDAAHSYNVAYSDEIGHFEYCKRVKLSDLTCAKGSDTDNNLVDQDDDYCLPGFLSLLVKINGCFGSPLVDGDFDGASYGHNWPGSVSSRVADRKLHSTPLKFSSPTFRGGKNYGRVAFEADLPRIEGSDIVFNAPPCQRHVDTDPNPGAHCVNPPPGAAFYPFYTTTKMHGHCIWQEGGKYLPATHKFGGSSKTEFGKTFVSTYPDTGFTTINLLENFRRILPNNPCKNDF